MITVTELSSFFFFKQKTAYELRISDWSSDVCSSDLVSQIALDGAVKGAPPITDKGPAGKPVIPNRVGGLGEILNTAPQLLQRLSTLTERLAELADDENQASIRGILKNVHHTTAIPTSTGPTPQKKRKHVVPEKTMQSR